MNERPTSRTDLTPPEPPPPEPPPPEPPPPELQPWLALRRHTPARIGLGRVGASLPTQPLLEFGLAHAQARDAVHATLDARRLLHELRTEGFDSVLVSSAASDRTHYLRRPDAGRRLDDASSAQLRALAAGRGGELVFVVADGLSAAAVNRHALPLLRALRPRLAGWKLAPIVVAQQARVALGDEIGELWSALQVVMLIGERPGLSSPDSLGAYLTYAPRIGRTDAERNCLSNIRAEGLSYDQAAHRLAFLVHAARQLQASGVALKDDSDLPQDCLPAPPRAS
jgi:ethanolamine ammonia-lyase small subunit